MPLAYANLLLRGQPGTTVDLSVLRRKPEPQKLTMTRAVVTPPAVESKMLPDSIGYIKVPTMGYNRVKEVATAVADLQKQGAKKLLLDLRYSASGNPEDGVELANLFLDKGLITYSVGQKSPRKNFEADPKKDVTALPLVVMTNRGTAAAAEVAAAALQADKRATLVGEHTYGDASVLNAIKMDDGSAIILSTAKYYSPDGKSIQDNGVTPEDLVAEAEIGGTDVDVDDDTEPAPKATIIGADKKAGQAVAGTAGTATTDDLILQKAIEIAQKKG
jgi:carboxyl-terminal processing protease